MGLSPPTALLERSFVHALTVADDPHHADADRCYRELVDEFAAERRLLTITSDLRAELNGYAADVLAPVGTLHVAAQERHAAAHVVLDPRTGPADEEFALHLVLVQRHRIATVATFDERFALYDITVLPGSAD
jgi:predicted nucleic acid-binding protein